MIIPCRFENVLLNSVTVTETSPVTSDCNIGKHIMNAFFLCLPHASGLFPDAQSDKAGINNAAKLVMMYIFQMNVLIIIRFFK